MSNERLHPMCSDVSKFNNGIVERLEYRGPDPIVRKPLVISSDVRVSEVNDALLQLMEFLPPSKSSLNVSDVLRRIREYIRAIILTGCDVSVNMLLFHIQVKCTPGHGIEIFIKRIFVICFGCPRGIYTKFRDIGAFFAVFF